MAISKEIREWVRERAQYLCEYCHSLEEAFINQRSPPTPVTNPQMGKWGGLLKPRLCLELNGWRLCLHSSWENLYGKPTVLH